MTLAARIQRHNKAANESTMNAEEALVWAKAQQTSTGHWPRRCWRVEGTVAGNSRLVTEKRAQSIQARAGGQVVRLIPTPTSLGLPVRTVNQSRADGLPACPKCGAEVGFPCRAPKQGDKSTGMRTKDGKQRPPHAERVAAGRPPPPTLPPREWIHGNERQPHKACGSPGVCNCTCRFCRTIWKSEGRPGAPRPARAGGGIVRSHRDMPDEPNNPGFPSGGFA